MYTKLENLKDIEEGKKELKKIFIDPIIQYIETKKKDTYQTPDDYIESYFIVKHFSDLGKEESEESLFLYHNEVIKDYLEKYFKLISSQPKEKLIDLFIKQTENINCFLYWMGRIFTFLDRFYMKLKKRYIS